MSLKAKAIRIAISWDIGIEILVYVTHADIEEAKKFRRIRHVTARYSAWVKYGASGKRSVNSPSSIRIGFATIKRELNSKCN